jgi:hypothetical protein
MNGGEEGYVPRGVVVLVFPKVFDFHPVCGPFKKLLELQSMR